MNKNTHKVFRFVVRSVFHVIARIEVIGFDDIPEGQACVIACNHVGRLDAALAYYVLDRPDIIVLLAEKYRKYGFYRWLIRLVDGIFIDRYNADVGALRATLRRLQAGGILTITPEGTRSKSGNLIEGKPGGIFLAWKAGVPILPAALTGTEDAVVVDRLKHFRRLDIKAVAGPVFTLPAVQGKDREAAMQQYTGEVMCRIAALLPEDRRGVYADHPRLKELLEK